MKNEKKGIYERPCTTVYELKMNTSILNSSPTPGGNEDVIDNPYPAF